MFFKQKCTFRYADKFVKWPQVSPALRSTVLLNCLKTIRTFISTLFDCQFTTAQIQPLLEISNMIRMKVVANAVERTAESGSFENFSIQSTTKFEESCLKSCVKLPYPCNVMMRTNS